MLLCLAVCLSLYREYSKASFVFRFCRCAMCRCEQAKKFSNVETGRLLSDFLICEPRTRTTAIHPLVKLDCCSPHTSIRITEMNRVWFHLIHPSVHSFAWFNETREQHMSPRCGENRPGRDRRQATGRKRDSSLVGSAPPPGLRPPPVSFDNQPLVNEEHGISIREPDTRPLVKTK